MADFERRLLKIQLEFVCWSSAEHNNFSECSPEPKKGAKVIRVRGWQPHEFLGAACGSPYIVFISTSGMLRSSDIYIYNTCSYAWLQQWIYIIYLYCAKQRWPISNADN